MAYSVILKRSAENELDRLSPENRRRVIRHLLALADTPRPAGLKKLRGYDAYRLRVDNYRVLFTIDDAAQRIDVFAIGHRGEVYR